MTCAVKAITGWWMPSPFCFSFSRSAANGQEALAALAKNSYDLVLMDESYKAIVVGPDDGYIGKIHNHPWGKQAVSIVPTSGPETRVD
jgi:hypothetical protein